MRAGWTTRARQPIIQQRLDRGKPALFIRRPIVLLLCVLLASCGWFRRQPAPSSPAGSASAGSQQWHCRASPTAAWECFDRAGPIPAPAAPARTDDPEPETPDPTAADDKAASIGDAPEDGSADLAALIAADAPPQQETQTVEPAAGGESHGELEDYPASHYVVQLVAASRQSTIDALRESYQETGLSFFQVPDPDSELHLLLIGVFADYREARLAVESLQPPPTTDPWIRQLGPLQQVPR